MRLAAQDQVRDFMETAGQVCPARPAPLSIALAEFRTSLIQEELDELYEALGAQYDASSPYEPGIGCYFSASEGFRPSLVDAADALADLLYVVLGTGVALGIYLGPVFHIVHETNMAKFPGGVVLRREDGKIVKPEGWQGPEEKIRAELARQFKRSDGA